MSSHGAIYRRIIQVLLVSMVIPVCISMEKSALPTGTEVVTLEQWPQFTDDLDFKYIDNTDNQTGIPPLDHQPTLLGKTAYSADHIARSLQRFRFLAQQVRQCLSNKSKPTCLADFNQSLRAEFTLYRISQPARLTAYYTPTIDVMAESNTEYRYPIYTLPATPELRSASRQEIDFQNKLQNQGLELFYARDRYDVYLLHLEGGGRLRIHSPGNTHYQYVSYAGNNGKPFYLIEEYMVKHGMLRADHTSQIEQRQYLQQHPDVVEAVYSSSPGYVYFSKSRHAPVGSAGIPLMPNRSLAVDPHYYPVQGLIVYVKTKLPRMPPHNIPLSSNPRITHYKPLQQFFISQDEGPYIKGLDRFDLYFGEDDYAYFLANNFRSEGVLYFLMLK